MIKDEILHLRRELLGPSLSISYRKPLHIVRGRGQYLYAENGDCYLDCVNNVCHVGHCHEGVVKAGADQLALLNTNTRYLHENIIKLARRLVKTMEIPGKRNKLKVCFFVNSGSEANDLALRLARNYTKRKGVICLSHAYHGHTASLIEISPYKYWDQGRGKIVDIPPSTLEVDAPDTYRGKYRGENAAALYAEDVEDAIREGRKRNVQVAAMFAESIMGCAGQIPLPDGYLSKSFESVRKAGGVCICDEVQTGFGRVGRAWWAWQLHNVEPDIVTMGKPMGNGFPLAAVVCTADIAEAFHNGIEYFNTFGGNPVSCAIGLAVLDTIEKDGLRKNAIVVGNYLIEGFRRLKQKFNEIGDVRGQGLFLGVELVKPGTDFVPDGMLAEDLVNLIQQRYKILLSTDGPAHNVIKLKPPMCITTQDAGSVLKAVEHGLIVLRQRRTRSKL